MLWQYLGEVGRFAFRRTTNTIDSLQVVAASAVPAFASILGVRMAPNLATETLAYIGAAGVAWIVLRLLCAPYFLWLGQIQEVAELKLQLSRPERLVLERIAKHRARARTKLASQIEDMQTYAYSAGWEGSAKQGVSDIAVKVRKYEAEGGVDQVFIECRKILMMFIKVEAELGNDKFNSKNKRKSELLTRAMQTYLVGDITAEDLALQLRSQTEQETQP